MTSNRHMKLRYTTEEMKLRFIEKYGDKFTYENFIYNGSHTKSIITCPIHGDFMIRPNDFLQGYGCSKCGIIKCSKSRSITDEEYIKRCNKVHKGNYLYDKTHTNGSLHNKVTITCLIHGDFEQRANDHLKGHGCSKCGGTKLLTTEEVIEKFKEVHKDRYVYSNVDYKNNRTKVCIICPKHGEFLQIPNSHFLGKGCPKCNRSHLENDIAVFLINNNIEYVEQKKFSWLGLQSLDFYLPKYKIGIECQGLQHFEPTKHFKNSEILLKRDELKYHLCEENGVRLLYYTDYNIDEDVLAKHIIYNKVNLFFTKEELLNKILRNQ